MEINKRRSLSHENRMFKHAQLLIDSYYCTSGECLSMRVIFFLTRVENFEFSERRVRSREMRRKRQREFDFSLFFFFFTRLTHFFHEKNKIWDSRLKRDRDSSGTIIEIPVSWRKISPGREQTGCFLFQGPIYFLSYISRQPHKVFRALVVLWWNGFYIIAIIPRCVDNTGLDPIEILEAIFSWSSSFFPSLFPFLLKYTYPFPFPNIDAFDAFH